MTFSKKDIKSIGNERDSEEKNYPKTYERTEENQNETEEKLLVSSRDMNIHSFVRSQIENAILVENIGTEMTYSISNKPEHTKNYESFFHNIEKIEDSLGTINSH